jgi:hypothetical protein
MLGPQDIQQENLENPPVTPEPAPEGDRVISSAAEGENYAKKKITEILGVEQKTNEDYKVKAVLEYAKAKGADTIEDILWEVRYLANQLGTPGYGESRLSFLYEYIYLLNESKTIKDKLKKMEVFNA